MLTIRNDGPEIAETNYWTSEQAKAGYLYLSTNAGTFRLLVPEKRIEFVTEMLTASEAILSRGPWPEQGGRDAVEILGIKYWPIPGQEEVGEEEGYETASSI